MSRTVQNDRHVMQAFEECTEAISRRRNAKKIRGKMYYYLGSYPLINANYKVAACRQVGFVATVHGTTSESTEFRGRHATTTSFAVYIREPARRKK